MLVIKNIKVVFDKQRIPIKIRTLHIGYKNDTRHATKKYHQTDSHTYTWN